MRPFAVTLQVVSSLLIVLGLGIAGGLALLLMKPTFELEHDPISFLAAGALLLMPVGVAFSFRWFHESVWPAATVSVLGFMGAAGALYCLGEASRDLGPFAGIVVLFLVFLGVAVMVSAGLLMLGGTLSLAAGRMVEKENRKA